MGYLSQADANIAFLIEEIKMSFKKKIKIVILVYPIDMLNFNIPLHDAIVVASEKELSLRSIWGIMLIAS